MSINFKQILKNVKVAFEEARNQLPEGYRMDYIIKIRSPRGILTSVEYIDAGRPMEAIMPPMEYKTDGAAEAKRDLMEMREKIEEKRANSEIEEQVFLLELQMQKIRETSDKIVQQIKEHPCRGGLL